MRNTITDKISFHIKTLRILLSVTVIIVMLLPIQLSAAAPDGMVWVYIDDPGVPGHEPFKGYMSKYKTTNAQYCQFLNEALASGDITVGADNIIYGADGSNIRADYVGLDYYHLNGNGLTAYGATSGGAARINYSGGVFTIDSGFDNHPVTYVTWYGATAFCNYYNFRLPTAWEWQAVADYDGSYIYGCGTSINTSIANCQDSIHPNGTTVVGSFGTYGYGMCDMAGNLWEWMDDTPHISGPDISFPIKSGLWMMPGNNLCKVTIGWLGSTSAIRIYGYMFGFRVVLDHLTVSLSATSNWDGKTINLSWSSGAGKVQVYRKKENGPFEHITTVSGLSYTDTVDEPGKNYTYVLKNSGGMTISNEATVKAEVIVVLVRGYSSTKSGRVNSNYWKPEGHSELVDVEQELVNKGITCWVPPQGVGPGEGLCGWKTIEDNASELKTFIESNRVGQYQNAKINLIGHSMGGLISRKYAHDNPGIVGSIFCIQTPHTGSPLAELKAYWGNENNEATENLKPSYLKTFNEEYCDLGNTKLFSLWSISSSRVCEDAGLALGALAILPDKRFTPGTSDGAVPSISAAGAICWWVPLTQLWLPGQKVDMDGLNNSNLDHYSCHRHPDTLETIMDWLGLPYTQSAAQSMGMVLAQAEGGEPAIVPQHYVAGFTGEFDNIADVNETISIGDSNSAYFRAITSDASCSFWLTDPCGTTYDEAYASLEPNVTYSTEDEIFMYEVSSPIPGIWTLNLSTTITTPDYVDYGLTVFESENIALHSYSNPSWANKDANMLIVAALTENDNPLPDAIIVANIVLLDVNSWSLTLYDDGLHNDANADDGVYANIFNSTVETGTYNGQVKATGLSSLGTNFERNSSLSFTISSLDIDFSGDINDVRIDLNVNGLYDTLRFTIPVDVYEPNDYLLTATLSDSNDALIKLFSSGSLTLPVGPNIILLEITAEDIVTHDVNGPYTLSDITISNTNTGLTIAEANDYNTVAYSVAAFEPLDTDNDGLSDNLELLIGTDIDQADSDFDGISDYDEVGYDGDANSYNVATDLNPLNADTDSDGMGDGWEINFEYEPLFDDGAKNDDDDNDGLINLEEFQNSTLPNNSDTDSDGISDGNEINIYTTNPTNIDTDADGLIDGDEVDDYGTIPTNPDTDGDTILDGIDNCKLTLNPGQNDLDGDGVGDICDNCQNTGNPGQSDMDADGKGDECDCLADLSNNNFVNLEDFALFASHWSDTGCTGPDYCGATDFDKSGTVDLNDLTEIAQKWLDDVGP